MSEPPTLFFAPRTCARVTLTAFEEIGLPFKTRLIAFASGEHRHPDYLSVNPGGKVPALDTGTGVITQNGAILSYLVDAYPSAGLLPQRTHAYGRATMLAELFRCSSDLHPLVTRFVMAPMMSSVGTPAEGIRMQAAEQLMAQLAPLEGRLTEQDWCLEEGWSIIDAYLAWIWFRICDSGFDSTAFPRIAGHYARASERPSAIAALSHEARADEELAARRLQFNAPFSAAMKAEKVQEI